MPFCAVTVRSKDFDHPEKNSKKNQKNLKFCGIEDSHVRKARANFCVGWTLRELVAKENKNNLCLWTVNSKKIAKKFKKIEFIWRQRGLSAQGACKFWWSNDVRGALEKKTKYCIFSKFFWAKICFFLHELLRCPNTTKTCTHLAHLNIFSPTKFHNFLIFFYFFEFTVRMRTKFMFSFATSSQGVRTAWKFVHTLQIWVSSIPQSFNFYLFILLFFQDGQSPLTGR